MAILRNIFVLIGLLFVIPTTLFATHNRAGVITYRQVDSYTFDFTITTYTKVSVETDRPILFISFGDNTQDSIPRLSQTQLSFPYDDIYINIYETQHTFGGDGTYTINVEDPNRNDGVVNMPGSVNIPFYIETILTINPLLGGVNNSPRPLQPPIDIGYVDFLYIYNLNAYDEDGDSLSYSLIPCKGKDGKSIDTYSDPEASTSLTIDKFTGEINWNTPVEIGEYNIAILIKEYRKVNNKVFQIGSVIQDMQINILDTDNEPPLLFLPEDTCVIAGDLLSFVVLGVDTNEVVTLTATSGPHQQSSNPAQFNQPVSALDSVTSTYTWQTNCSHVREQPYQAVFKAIDDDPNFPQFTMKQLLITVLGPPVQNPTAKASGNAIDLSWDKYECSNIKGYNIYRKLSYYGFIPDSCENGVPAYTGYSLLKEISGRNTTTYTDDNDGNGLARGFVYFYMFTAVFSEVSEPESIASFEVGDTLIKDVPVITNVSIAVTDKSAGIDTLVWSKPVIEDSSALPGPYKYYIYRSDDFKGNSLSLIDSLFNINDTIYTDSNLNTFDNPYSYRIDFYNNTPGNKFFVGSSTTASSIYLSLKGADNQIVLSWKDNVSWQNYQHIVYRKNDATGQYDSIAVTTTNSYTDTHLVNLKEYCYLIKSLGTFSAPGFKSLLINYSQKACGYPIDTIPTCPPVLSATNDCDLETGVNCSKSIFYNSLLWTNPNDTCDSASSVYDDVIKYVIYYSPDTTSDIKSMTVIDTIQSPTKTDTVHELTTSIAGCYAITSIDSFYNESAPSNFVCLDNCPIYELPNVFTPNSDGSNDNFNPHNPYCFVESVHTRIYNRWGQLVFEDKENTDINWNGQLKNEGRPCTPSVYYYVCTINERHVYGIVSTQRKGFIHLMR
ncbi:MAG: hypothetical protein COC01_06665 [Bacteroidetes bacterium]|nr:MAG: hypothetical protein COC01_06665 [Bacteroidota bacterium]